MSPVLLFLLSSAHAATVCLEPGACDFTSINDCAYDLPLDDDTCLVQPGVYREQVGTTELARGGLVFQCTEPRACVVDGDHVRDHGFLTNAWRIRGFEIRHTVGHAITGITGSDGHQPVEVSDCYLHDIGGAGIMSVGEHGVAERNELRNIWDWGIVCADSRDTFQVVENNLVVDAGLRGARPAIWCTVEQSLVLHNTVDVRSGTPPAFQSTPEGINGRDVRYNLVLGGHRGIWATDRAEGNLTWGFALEGIGSSAGAVVTNNLVADPLVYGRADTFLQAGSPARDLGSPDEAGQLDLYGSPRDAWPDLGAIEHDPDHLLDPGAFPVAEVVAAPGRKVGPATAIVPGHGPVMAWADPTEQQIRFAMRTAEGWEVEVVETGWVGPAQQRHAVSYVDLEVDPVTGQPALVWVQRVDGRSVVRHAFRQPDACGTECESSDWYGCDDAPILVSDGELDVDLELDAATGAPAVGVLQAVGTCNSQSGGSTGLHHLRSTEGGWAAQVVATGDCDGDLSFLADFDLALDPTGAATYAYTRVDGDGFQPVDFGGGDLYYATEDAGAFTTEAVPLGAGVRGFQGDRTFVALDHTLVDGAVHTAVALPITTAAGRSAIGFTERIDGWAPAATVVADHYGQHTGFHDSVDVAYADDGLPAVIASVGTMLVLTEPLAREASGTLPHWSSTVVDAQRMNGVWPDLVFFDGVEILVGHQHESAPHWLKLTATADPGTVTSGSFLGPDTCDLCPDDPDKTEPGVCGCGVTERACLNEPPVLGAVGDRVSVLSEVVAFTLSATDPDGDPLSFTVEGLPPGVTATDTGAISGAPTLRGTFLVDVAVSDGLDTDTASFTWIVANRAPTLAQVPDQQDHVGDPVAIGLDAADPDGDPLTYGAQDLPPGIVLDPATGVLSGAPTEQGTWQVTATAADGQGGTAATVFTWTVPNRAPSLVSPGDQETVAGAPVTLVLSASDPDGDPLTWQSSGLPAGLSLTGGVISGAPLDKGVYGVVLLATDPAGAFARAEILWTVLNRGPSVVDPGDQSTELGVPVTLALTGSDPDGDALTWTVDGLPPGLEVVSGEIAGTPTVGGTWEVTLHVSDGEATASTGFTWHVFVTNAAPVLESPGDQSTEVSEVVLLPISASDPDGDALTFTATGLPPGLLVDGATGTVSGTPDPGTEGTWSVQIAVSDGLASDAVQITWTVWREYLGDACTRTQGYWKNHEESWPLAQVPLGLEVLPAADALALLRTPTRGDATVIAAHQLIATRLNVASGANASIVLDEVAATDAWLAEVGGIGTRPKGGLRNDGIALAQVLDLYNNGYLGPPHCE